MWRDITVLKWAAQLVVLAVLAAIFWILASTGSSNIDQRGLTFSWRWLTDPPDIALREGIDLLPDSGRRAMLVGIVNMLRVSASGIIVATLLGTIIGVARLSRNWIVNKTATAYIETIRNIPLLVQIFFWAAVVRLLAEPVEADIGTKWLHMSSKGLVIPWIRPDIGFWQWFIFVIAGVFLARYVYRARLRHLEETGEEPYAFTYALGALVAVALIGWFAHPLLSVLGPVWGGVASVFDALPIWLVQAVLALGALALAGRWVKNFLDSLRTPAGLAKLTDDDIFRIVFASLVGLVFALLFVLQGGISEAVVDLGRNLFEFFDGKFGAADGGGLRTGLPMRWSRPFVEVQGANFFQYGTGGVVITQGFFAIWVGVTLYTASFIAEIVRGGILAVAKGQTEAGSALGLSRSQSLRLVVLPQAFRIILPPLGNQYLNLAKNTSLGLAVSYPEIVFVGQTLYNQTGQTLPIVLFWMGFYLTVSLVLSSIVNYYNRKLQLVER